jgi:hypothetical protein
MKITIETQYKGQRRAWWTPREEAHLSMDIGVRALFYHALYLLRKTLRFDRRYRAEVESYRIRLGNYTIGEFPVAKLEELL